MKPETKTLLTLLKESSLIKASVQQRSTLPLHPTILSRHQLMEDDLSAWIEMRLADGENLIDLYFEVDLFLTIRHPDVREMKLGLLAQQLDKLLEHA